MKKTLAFAMAFLLLASIGIVEIAIAEDLSGGVIDEDPFTYNITTYSATVAPGDDISVDVSLGLSGTGPSVTYPVTSDGWNPDSFLSGWTFTSTAATYSWASVTSTVSDTLSIHVPSSASGTYTFIAYLTPGKDSSTNTKTVGAGVGIPFTITVSTTSTNNPPSLTVDSSSVTVNEGQTATNTGIWSDADAGDTVTLSASIGTVLKSGTNAGGTWSWSFATTDGPDQSQTVTITADDGHVTTSTTFDLTVNNVAPTVGAIVIPTDPVQIGVAIPISAPFTDPGTLDTHTAVWNWDDGTTNAGTVTESGGSGSVNDSHSYATPGIYTVSVTVTDKDGGVGTSTATTYIVIYDPNGGFVTGGGWIDSPVGAYLVDPTIAGKANFGFVSKYQKGANTPVGETEFQFKAGNLNFHSSSYDWLVVAGTKAMYKGTGTINGAGNYGFLLSAIDGSKGQPDKFRIKIWNKDEGDVVVYDNQVSGDKTDNADPSTAIGGGSIVVHK